jgi:hypothetical protein
MHRSHRLALLAALLAAPAAGQQLFHDDFESGLGQWTVTAPPYGSNLFHLESSSTPCGASVAPFPSGTWVAYSGISASCNYQALGVVYSSLELATPLTLPAAGPRATLRFTYRIHTEPFNCEKYVDQAYVEVRSPAGTVLDIAWGNCDVGWTPDPTRWHEMAVDLTPLLGQTIALRFRFLSVDDIANTRLGWMIDDVSIELEPGVASCGAPCPCPDQETFVPHDRLRGCKHSQGHGGILAGEGTASVSADTLALHATQMGGTTTAVFFQGTAAAFAPLYDGLRCAGGSLVRLGLRPASGGAASLPAPGGLSIAALGQLPSTGGLRVYQVLYRDAASFCTPGTANLTHAYTVTWSP